MILSRVCPQFFAQRLLVFSRVLKLILGTRIDSRKSQFLAIWFLVFVSLPHNLEISQNNPNFFSNTIRLYTLYSTSALRETLMCVLPRKELNRYLPSSSPDC